jgi:hypothetical protein
MPVASSFGLGGDQSFGLVMEDRSGQEVERGLDPHFRVESYSGLGSRADLLLTSTVGEAPPSLVRVAVNRGMLISAICTFVGSNP